MNDFVTAQEKSELDQLKSFIQFIKSQKLISYLKVITGASLPSDTTVRCYEVNNYHLRLEEAYAKQVRKLEPGVKIKIIVPVSRMSKRLEIWKYTMPNAWYFPVKHWSCLGKIMNAMCPAFLLELIKLPSA